MGLRIYVKGRRETQLFDWMLINVTVNWWKFITLLNEATQIGTESGLCRMHIVGCTLLNFAFMCGTEVKMSDGFLSKLIDDSQHTGLPSAVS